MEYKDLDIWKLSRKAALDIHEMTLKYLPNFELYETGQQIRRSSKSVKSNIVEGYGRRRYKQDFIRFLVYSHSSNSETIDHLETLMETGSLKNKVVYESIMPILDELGRKLNKFISAVEAKHNEF